MKHSVLILIVLLANVVAVFGQESVVDNESMDRGNYFDLSYNEVDSIVEKLFRKAQDFRKANDKVNVFSTNLKILAYEQFMRPGSENRWKVQIRLSNSFHILGANNLGLKHRFRAYTIYLKARSTIDSWEKKPDAHLRMLSGVAGSYMHVSQHDSAKVYFRKCIDFSAKVNTVSSTSVYNNMAILFLKTEETDSAKYYLDKAFSSFNGRSQAMLLSLQDNLILLAFQKKEYKEALTLAKSNLQISLGHKQVHRRVQANLRVAEALQYMNRFKDATKYLVSAENEIETLVVSKNIELTNLCYRLWQKHYIQIGNLTQAYEYVVKELRFNQKLERENQKLLDAFVELLTRARIEKMQQDILIQQMDLYQQGEQLKLINEKARLNWLLFISVGVVSLLVLILLIVVFKKRAIAHKKKQHQLAGEKQVAELKARNKELESQKLKHELKHKVKDLSDLAFYLSQIREFNAEVISRMSDLSKLHSDDQAAGIRSLVSDVISKLQMHERTGLIQESIDEVNEEFYEHLKGKFNKLTRLDIELCGLIRLNLSNKEIANLKNVKVESVKMSRRRLRKKLNLDIEQRLQEFLSGL